MAASASLKVRSEVRGKGQVTIPASVRKEAHLEAGDLVEIEVTPEGILLRPLKAIEASQAWFWTEEWQSGEREASQDVRAGRTTSHATSEEFLSSLEK